MQVHRYATDPLTLLSACDEALKAEENSDYILRVLAVRAVLGGKKSAEVADLLSVSATAVNHWVRTADQHGIEALKTQPRPGRPRLLTPEQYEEINAVLRQPACGADPDYPVWDGATLSDYLRKQYGVQVSERSCRRILHELNDTRRRAQADPAGGRGNTEERGG